MSNTDIEARLAKLERRLDSLMADKTGTSETWQYPLMNPILPQGSINTISGSIHPPDTMGYQENRIRELEDTIRMLTEERRSLVTDNTRLKDEWEGLGNHNRALEGSVATLKERVASLEDTIRIQGIRIQNLSKENTDLSRAREITNEACELRVREYNTLKEEYSELAQSHSKVAYERDTLARASEMMSRDHEALRQAYEQLVSENQKVSRENQVLVTERNTIQDKWKTDLMKRMGVDQWQVFLTRIGEIRVMQIRLKECQKSNEMLADECNKLEVMKDKIRDFLNE